VARPRSAGARRGARVAEVVMVEVGPGVARLARRVGDSGVGRRGGRAYGRPGVVADVAAGERAGGIAAGRDRAGQDHAEDQERVLHVPGGYLILSRRRALLGGARSLRT
jgi:hypothetical protein